MPLLRKMPLLFLFTATLLAQTPQDEIVKLTAAWLHDISIGDKAALNTIMDPHFIATTPGGDLLTKERLVPDGDRPVQKLPAMQLDAPLVRITGDTAVLMSRLPSPGGPAMNATFVYGKRDGAWKLLALQMSPQK